MFMFDRLYLILVMPTMVLAMWASWRVRSAFAGREPRGALAR